MKSAEELSPPAEKFTNNAGAIPERKHDSRGEKLLRLNITRHGRADGRTDTLIHSSGLMLTFRRKILNQNRLGFDYLSKEVSDIISRTLFILSRISKY